MRTLSKSGVPTGIRTPVIAVKGRCPRPLDDGDIVVHPERFERPTLWFVARYSIQLSYGCTGTALNCCGVPTGIRTPVIAVKGRCPRPLDDGDICGASGAIRTPDPLVRSQILYPTELRMHCATITLGGERGIRTLDTGLCPYAPLAGECLRPLGHFSVLERCELYRCPHPSSSAFFKIS